ncbi:uncharacterized protein LOC125944603 [Dermacentor silvarum]|uniref:uncharacterized protein LOC125944603 n=1 Tax=Dermacentor silvarum TaxID=543639 RepID=UPI0021016FAE|nr:uncharacterized protein LOC125944603 [Dermacentor silvarum]
MSFQSSAIVSLLGSSGLCGSSGCSLTKNNTCNGTIKISFPAIGGFSTCFANTQTCTTGTSTTTSNIQSLFQVVACLLKKLSLPQFLTVLRGIGCQLVNALNSATQGGTLLQLLLLGFSASLQTSLGLNCTASG